MRRVLLVAVILLSQACAASPARSATCPPSTRVDPRWKAVVDVTGEAEIRIPASLQAAPPGKYQFVHGGTVWEDAHVRVSLSWGHWAEDSFPDQEGERCRVRIGGANVFVIVGKTRILAWYDRRSGTHEPLVVVTTGAEGEIGKLSGIAFSLKQRGGR